MLHVNGSGADKLTFGVVVFCVTVVEADAVHPLIGSVAVTVYVPPLLTDLELPIPPPLHAKDAPAVVEEAVSV